MGQGSCSAAHTGVYLQHETAWGNDTFTGTGPSVTCSPSILLSSSLVLVKVSSHLPVIHGFDAAVNLAEGLPWEWLCMCNFPEGRDTEGGNLEQGT